MRAVMTPYRHTVQYYETDRMGITHHSNYIRWMEEARIDFMKQIGWEYAKLEELGIISPVLGVSCEYKASTTFSDEVLIDIRINSFTGVRMELAYTMKKVLAAAEDIREAFEEGQLVCEAVSRHCFLDADGRPVRLKRDFPALYETLLSYTPEK